MQVRLGYKTKDYLEVFKKVLPKQVLNIRNTMYRPVRPSNDSIMQLQVISKVEFQNYQIMHIQKLIDIK